MRSKEGVAGFEKIQSESVGRLQCILWCAKLMEVRVSTVGVQMTGNIVKTPADSIIQKRSN